MGAACQCPREYWWNSNSIFGEEKRGNKIEKGMLVIHDMYYIYFHRLTCFFSNKWETLAILSFYMMRGVFNGRWKMN